MGPRLLVAALSGWVVNNTRSPDVIDRWLAPAIGTPTANWLSPWTPPNPPLFNPNPHRSKRHHWPSNSSFRSAECSRFMARSCFNAPHLRKLSSLVGFCLVSLGCTRFYWVLLGFTGFYWVLLGFTGFYWVSLGFIEFYWVFNVVLGCIRKFWRVSLGFIRLGSAALVLVIFGVSCGLGAGSTGPGDDFN